RAGECAFEDELIILARLKAVVFEEGSERRRFIIRLPLTPALSPLLRRGAREMYVGEKVGDIEDGLNRAAFLAAADKPTVGAFAEDEVERADDDGFARAGFTRDDVATRLEFKREVGHQGEVFNAQCRQHLRPQINTDEHRCKNEMHDRVPKCLCQFVLISGQVTKQKATALSRSGLK